VITWPRKKVMKKFFFDHMVMKRGDTSFGGHMVKKRGDAKLCVVSMLMVVPQSV
jgi:hypothetical protein